MQRTIWTTAVTLALVAGLGTAVHAPAGADSRLVAQSVAVSYGDLNLNAEAGVERLYRRLKNAAEKTCGTRYLSGSLITEQRWRTCVADALNRAVAEVDHRGLAAYHAARTEAGGRSGDRVAAVVERN